VHFFLPHSVIATDSMHQLIMHNEQRLAYHWECCSHWQPDHWWLQLLATVTEAISRTAECHWETRGSRRREKRQRTAQTATTNTYTLPLLLV